MHEWKVNNGATKKWGTILKTKEGGNSDEPRELDISNKDTLKSSSNRRTLGGNWFESESGKAQGLE